MQDDDGSRGSAGPRAAMLLIAFNQEATIAEAIAGALAQTWSPLEIIVSDDAEVRTEFGEGHWTHCFLYGDGEASSPADKASPALTR